MTQEKDDADLIKKVIVTVYVNGKKEDLFISDPQEMDEIEWNDFVDKATNSDSSLVLYRQKTTFYFRKEVLNNSVIAITEVD